MAGASGGLVFSNAGGKLLILPDPCDFVVAASKRRPLLEVRMSSSKIILVADGHDDSRNVYCTILQFAGFDVWEARSGSEVLELCASYLPFAVILEATLPVVDGGEVLRRLKLDPLTAPIHVIMLTSDANPTVRQEAEALGCAAFQLKPFAPRLLLEVVQGLHTKSLCKIS